MTQDAAVDLFYGPFAGTWKAARLAELVWRHTFDPESGWREPFRSSCVDVECTEP